MASGGTVAIVGRPNVGKSTLFNRLTGRRQAIVEDTPGVTRDRIYGEAEWAGRTFAVIDTGGFDPAAREPIPQLVREQAEVAIAEADVVILVLDGTTGPTPADRELYDLLRRAGKPVVVAVNKADRKDFDASLAEVQALGAERLVPVSAEHGRGVDELLDAVVEALPPATAPPPAAPEGPRPLRLAVVGRTNVGKSSLVNRILGYERVIVSELPGTTRDPIDTPFTWQGRPMVIVDTAGIRRRARTETRLEKVSVVAALKALARCDVAALVLDAAYGITDQDQTIGAYAAESGCGVVIVANKWDLVPDGRPAVRLFTEAVRRALPHLAFSPIVFTSATRGYGVRRLLEQAVRAAEAAARRVPTGQLNRALREAVERLEPPVFRNRRVKIFYGAQLGSRPPTFAIVTSAPEGLPESYRRYLAAQLRERFDFEGAPLRLVFRERRRRARPGRSGEEEPRDRAR
ncbi:MAG TPA: ribosome biogenesis GTPase Der [Thermodesulfobacteriota bacterium]|nr:ribosome biogenesis GTPase Der [Thermodesulfobacteriota bacterium]